MACADTGDNLGLIAAALSAMTNKHIVSKSEYLSIQKRARFGINTGYIFKGEVNVLQTIEQTYADTFQLVTGLQPTQQGSTTVFQRASKVVRCAIGGVGAAVGLSAIASVSSGAPLNNDIEMNEMGYTHEGISIHSPVVEDKVPLINNESMQIFISSTNGVGVTICVTMPSYKNTVHELKLRIKEKLGIKTEDQCLSYQGTLLQDTNTLQAYHITNNSTIMLTVRVRGGSSIELHYLDSTYMDPSWNCDFTGVSDGGNKFIRGGYPYYRPCGWKRIAIKVAGKYRDETWLGHTDSEGEWAVTYHGTSQPVFDSICEEGYIVGTRNAYGKGVYSSPYINEAKAYAIEFKYKGVRYFGVFQNRVNPKGVNIVNDGKYWVCPNPADIRPYGLCVKPVKASRNRIFYFL